MWTTSIINVTQKLTKQQNSGFIELQQITGIL